MQSHHLTIAWPNNSIPAVKQVSVPLVRLNVPRCWRHISLAQRPVCWWHWKYVLCKFAGDITKASLGKRFYRRLSNHLGKMSVRVLIYTFRGEWISQKRVIPKQSGIAWLILVDSELRSALGWLVRRSRVRKLTSRWMWTFTSLYSCHSEDPLPPPPKKKNPLSCRPTFGTSVFIHRSSNNVCLQYWMATWCIMVFTLLHDLHCPDLHCTHDIHCIY